MNYKNYIELPQDEWGNRGYTQSQPIVVEGYIEPDENMGDWTWLHITRAGGAEFGGDRVLQQQGTILWADVDHAPGPITEQEWAALVLSVEGLPQWMTEAVRRRLPE